MKRGPSLMLCSVLALLLVFVLWLFVEPRMLMVAEDHLELDDFPSGLAGYRIAFVSDIHHGPFLDRGRVEEMVRRINLLKPDLVLLGGDYVHRSGAYIDPVFAALGGLRASDGVFAVLGNHDSWESRKKTRNAMDRAGIVCIDNQQVRIRRGESVLVLSGLADILTDRVDYRVLSRSIEPADFQICLVHNPDAFEHLPAGLVDLALAGHTHGGQVTLFGWWAPVISTATGQKYKSGVYHAGDATLVVSNGVGTITPPVRFFAPPQINLLVLDPPASDSGHGSP